MITLKKLKWSNCFSYGADNELDLGSSTLTQIVGTNGMGKSSIPLIIEEALFNKNSKNIKKADIPNRYINKGYDIYLSFSVEDKLYEVSIVRRGNLKISLTEDGVDISSHTATDTYKTMQKILGIDYKTFTQLVYQNTNSSLQFLTATDTTRKKFLIDLLHLEEYVQLFEVFKEAAKESASNLTALNSQMVTIEKWLKDNTLADTTILPLLEIQINTEEDEKLLQTLTAELRNISEKNKKIGQNNKYKEMLAGIDITKAHDIKASQVLSYDHLQEEGGELTSQISSSKQLLDKLGKLGDHCPTCEQSVDSLFKQQLIDAEKEKVAAATQRLDNVIKPEIKSIKENNEQYQRKISIEKNWTDLYKSIDRTMEENPVDGVELAGRIEGVRRRISDERAKLEHLSGENQKRTKRNTRIQVIQEQMDKFQEELDTASKLLSKEKVLSSSLEVLKKAFSTNGLLAYKIENLVKELEELTNTYLAELSDGRFTLEFVVSNDKLNVVITDNGNTIDILALSSGELARVNTATLIAIRKLMSSISKSKLNILFLDEVINVLDEAGKEKLVEVLLGEEELNTYIVSHQWTHPLLEKVEIVKRGNISALEK
jgi:DNA repair exonuclease SbcCD ATPase subunit